MLRAPWLKGRPSPNKEELWSTVIVMQVCNTTLPPRFCGHLVEWLWTEEEERSKLLGVTRHGLWSGTGSQEHKRRLLHKQPVGSHDGHGRGILSPVSNHSGPQPIPEVEQIHSAACRMFYTGSVDPWGKEELNENPRKFLCLLRQ